MSKAQQYLAKTNELLKTRASHYLGERDVSLAHCEYNKQRKMLTYNCAAGFPLKITVISHHTGKRIVFVQDFDAAIECEFWDGEQMVYIPVTELPNVEKLVVIPYE